jgi:hypothetical protein
LIAKKREEKTSLLKGNWRSYDYDDILDGKPQTSFLGKWEKNTFLKDFEYMVEIITARDKWIRSRTGSLGREK